ncbi:MAG: RnfABCDGE type electron transport complex subunit D [Oscillospiraceae bacterium]|jgi:electron transport complex protein RnfD|nr:RnfABCDGE type electron transport complex subunit D [Oscillospiraceae bacterium]
MSKLVTVTAPPHIRAAETSTGVMLDVLIALVPAQIAAVWIFGWRSLIVTLVCIGTALVSEWGIRSLFKKPSTLGDLSAAVTGTLLAFCLPVGVPLWMAALGTAFAIIVVKQFFGGLGHNFANPAIAGRIFLLISFPIALTTWDLPKAAVTTDALTGATPLAILKTGGDAPDWLALLLGQHGGSYGEVCAAALLLGGLYLLCKRIISPIIPLVFIGTVAVGMFLAGGLDAAFAARQVLTGGLLLGAFFMATDYVTSPMTPWGKVLYALGCGGVTLVIRLWGNMPEGVSYAILLMNIATPLLERVTQPKIFGSVKKSQKASKEQES